LMAIDTRSLVRGQRIFDFKTIKRLFLFNEVQMGVMI